MAAFNVFFDASGAPDDCDAVVMAGFVAKAAQWVEFERNWRDALVAYGVSALHMREFAHSLKEFSSWKGDEKRRARFLDRLVNIIETRVLHGFPCAVMMEAYRDIDRVYRLSEIHRPVALAGTACIDKVKRWSGRSGIDPKVICYIFEDGDTDKASLSNSIERQFGIVPIYLGKSESPAFQAADLLAYEHLLANRRIYKAGIGSLAFSDMRRSLQALDRIPHGQDGEDWGVYGKEELLLHCKMNNYPLRNENNEISVLGHFSGSSD